MSTVLLIADHQARCADLCTALERYPYDYDVVPSTHADGDVIRTYAPATIIIDFTSLQGDAPALCTALQQTCNAPIIAIANHKHDIAAVTRWVLPPQSPTYAVAVASNLLDSAQVVRAGSISLDLRARTVTDADGQCYHLRPKECDLLRLLMRNAGTVVSRTDIMAEVWETDYTADTRTLDVHIRWLREKVEGNPSRPRHIRTVRGVGYRFVVPDETSP